MDNLSRDLVNLFSSDLSEKRIKIQSTSGNETEWIELTPESVDAVMILMRNEKLKAGIKELEDQEVDIKLKYVEHWGSDGSMRWDIMDKKDQLRVEKIRQEQYYLERCLGSYLRKYDEV